jgi:hypothetical protein
MTYDDALVERLTGWRPEGTGPHSLAYSGENGWTTGVTAESTDTVGGRLTDLTVSRPAPAEPATGAGLKTWADRIADRTTGLLEPLKLIEVDDARLEAVLRSETPAVRGNSVEYYEVHLRGKRSASLKRYRATWSGSGKRRAVPFALTHEAIAKVAGDLAAE